MSYKGKKNRYVCGTCGGEIVTVDLDEGVTPFMLGCRATDSCKGAMQSAFYRVDGDPKPTHEWYTPSKGAIKRMSPEMQDHVRRGGLQIRPVGEVQSE